MIALYRSFSFVSYHTSLEKNLNLFFSDDIVQKWEFLFLWCASTIFGAEPRFLSAFPTLTLDTLTRESKRAAGGAGCWAAEDFLGQ